jgi:hypothetical protein
LASVIVADADPESALLITITVTAPSAPRSAASWPATPRTRRGA